MTTGCRGSDAGRWKSRRFERSEAELGLSRESEDQRESSGAMLENSVGRDRRVGGDRRRRSEDAAVGHGWAAARRSSRIVRWVEKKSGEHRERQRFSCLRSRELSVSSFSILSFSSFPRASSFGFRSSGLVSARPPGTRERSAQSVAEETEALSVLSAPKRRRPLRGGDTQPRRRLRSLFPRGRPRGSIAKDCLVNNSSVAASSGADYISRARGSERSALRGGRSSREPLFERLSRSSRTGEREGAAVDPGIDGARSARGGRSLPRSKPQPFSDVSRHYRVPTPTSPFFFLAVTLSLFVFVARACCLHPLARTHIHRTRTRTRNTQREVAGLHDFGAGRTAFLVDHFAGSNFRIGGSSSTIFKETTHVLGDTILREKGRERERKCESVRECSVDLNQSCSETYSVANARVTIAALRREFNSRLARILTDLGNAVVYIDTLRT